MAVDILCKDRERLREREREGDLPKHVNTHAIRKYKKHLSVFHDCLMIAVSDDCPMRLSDRLIVDRFKRVVVKT